MFFRPAPIVQKKNCTITYFYYFLLLLEYFFFLLSKSGTKALKSLQSFKVFYFISCFYTSWKKIALINFKTKHGVRLPNILTQTVLLLFWSKNRKVLCACTMQGRHQDFNPTKAKIQIFNQTAKKPVYLRSFLPGRIIKIVISSNLQRKPSIFKEYFAWKKNKDFFIQICQAVWAISYSLLYVVSKINQGSCLGCLSDDDAPVHYSVLFKSSLYMTPWALGPTTII